MATEACKIEEPPLAPTDHPNHYAACIYSGKVAAENFTYADIFPVPAVPSSPLEHIPREQRKTVLQLEGMKRHYPLMKGAIIRRRVGTVYAVDGIDLEIKEGETLGLVGESGCGKTSTLLEVLNLKPPTSGRVVVLGRPVGEMRGAERKQMRRDLQVVFQDPMASLDPRMLVFDLIAEPMGVFKVSKTEIENRVKDLLRLVGLEPSHASRYPQQFSGGQRQRIGIARALALEPKLIVLDEPVSALDVSIQAGVINLLDELKAKLSLSYLFVAHDLAVIRHIADRVAVMYLGKIVEIGEVNDVYDHPTHPYTQALLSAIPIADPDKERSRERIILTGDLPSPANPPSGCKFRTRCQKFPTLTEGQQSACIDIAPELFSIGRADHTSACHHNKEVRVV
jgi:peptide/nickel transport system ATP-binding protein